MNSQTENNLREAIVIGVSAGGMNALSFLFGFLPDGFPLPVVVAQHLHPSEDGFLFEYFSKKTEMGVKEVEDKEAILSGHIYFAPPNYHLLVERDMSFSLSSEDKVNHSRPSIDVLFESAAYAWSAGLTAVLLTGASSDGAYGMAVVRKLGGLAIAQDPKEAEYPMMPQSAIDNGGVDIILSLEEIGRFLSSSELERKTNKASYIEMRKD